MHHTVIEAYRRLFVNRFGGCQTVACTSVRPDGVSERAWHRWEDGEGVMPDEVAGNLLALIRRRQREIDSIAAQIASGTEPILTAPKKGGGCFGIQNQIVGFCRGNGNGLQGG